MLGTQESRLNVRSLAPSKPFLGKEGLSEIPSDATLCEDNGISGVGWGIVRERVR